MRFSDLASSCKLPGPCHAELVQSIAGFKPVDFLETMRALQSFVDLRTLVPPPKTHGHDDPTTSASGERTP